MHLACNRVDSGLLELHKAPSERPASVAELPNRAEDRVAVLAKGLCVLHCLGGREAQVRCGCRVFAKGEGAHLHLPHGGSEVLFG